MKQPSYSRDKKLSRSLKDKDLPITPTSGKPRRSEKQPSPLRYKQQPREKHSLSREKFKIQRIITDHNEMFNSGKRKVVSKTPKSGNTWLVRDSRAEERGVRSRSKLEKVEKTEVPNLETSISPKAFDNAFMYAEKSFLSTKAANRCIKGFSRNSDLKQVLEQKNRNYIRQAVISRNDNNSQSKSPLKQRTQDEIQTAKPSRLDNISTQKIRGTGIPCISDYDCQVDLTEDEFKNFGDRFPSTFLKTGLLGRGGFSLVWLGMQRKTKKKMAIKQILTKNPHQTHLKEIWFGNYFFTQGGEPREQFANHPGINNICKLVAYDIKPIDTWLFYELCEDSLANFLYDMRGYTLHDQRLYSITYKPLYHRMRDNPNELNHLIIELCKALMLLNAHNIVHSDLKTENILLRLNHSKPFSNLIKDVKIIDFGSSFVMTNLKQFSMATPEYMPPQILNYILYQNGLDYDEELLVKIKKYVHPWVIDIWSLGCIILEILHGVPVWMSLKTKVDNTDKYSFGLFAVKGRKFENIIAKQIQVVQRIDQILNNQCMSGIKISKELHTIVKRMLHLEPDQRISPREILTMFNIDCQPDRFPFF